MEAQKDLVRIQYLNGDFIEVKERKLIHKEKHLGIYKEKDYYCITTLSGFGIASKFRCLELAKDIVHKLSSLDEWDAGISRLISLYGETSYQYSFAADFAYLWSETAEEFREYFAQVKLSFEK